MAKRARVKGKGADIFFSESEEAGDEEQQANPDWRELQTENQRLQTEIEVLNARVQLLEEDKQRLVNENEEMRQRLDTYADAFAKVLFGNFTADSELAGILQVLIGGSKK